MGYPFAVGLMVVDRHLPLHPLPQIRLVITFWRESNELGLGRAVQFLQVGLLLALVAMQFNLRAHLKNIEQKLDRSKA
jgi:hypothetical protein